MNFLERRLKFSILQERANSINEKIDQIAEENGLTEKEAFDQFSRSQQLQNSQMFDKQYSFISSDGSPSHLINSICSSGFKYSQTPKSITQSQYQDVEDMYMQKDLQMSDLGLKSKLQDELNKTFEENEKRVFLLFKKDHVQESVEGNKIDDQYLTTNSSQFSRENSAFDRKDNKVYNHKKSIMIQYADQCIRNKGTMRK